MLTLFLVLGLLSAGCNSGPGTYVPPEEKKRDADARKLDAKSCCESGCTCDVCKCCNGCCGADKLKIKEKAQKIDLSKVE